MLNMWKHYCIVEKQWLEIGKGQSCNWCDTKESDDTHSKSA